METKKLSKIFEEIYSKKIVLPNFQREFKWKPETQKNLLASVLVKLSIGSLLLINGSPNDYASKKIGYAKENDERPNNECDYLLDGQQRLTSLWSFFNDIFADQNECVIAQDVYKNLDKMWDNLYSQLQYRWFVNIAKVGDSDFFGYEYLNFANCKTISEKEPGDIINHIISEHLNKLAPKARKCNWYHPSFPAFMEKKGKSADEVQSEYISEAAKETRIPLYAIGQKDLIEKIINNIAIDRRTEILKLIANKNFDEKKQYLLKGLFKDNKDICKTIDGWSAFGENEENYIEECVRDLTSYWKSDVKHFFDSICELDMNVMILEADQIQRAIAIFTAMNEGGTKLSTFDLVAAKAANIRESDPLTTKIINCMADNIDFSKSGIYSNEKSWTLNYMACKDGGSIEVDFQKSFINILSALVHTNFINDKKNFAKNLRQEYFKASMQLHMSPEQIADNFKLAMLALKRAFAFLQFRCGIVSNSDLIYRLMLNPIAFCLVNDSVWKDSVCIDRLEYWYWSSIFSGYYKNLQNEKSLEDTKLLYTWLVLKKGSDENIKNLMISRAAKIFQAEEFSDENTLLMTGTNKKIPGAIQSAFLQYILSGNPTDFLPKSMYSPVKLTSWSIAKALNLGDEIKLQSIDSNNFTSKEITKLEDHHIIALGGATSIGESSKKIRSDKESIYNSPLNRTLISNVANNLLSDKSIDDYYRQINLEALSDHIAPSFKEFLTNPDCDLKRIDINANLKKRFVDFKDRLSQELKTLLHDS